MRVFLTALLAVSTAFAYDAVIFSNTKEITNDAPSFEDLLSTATSDAPLVFLVNPDFTLGQFSRHASAYTSGKPLMGIAAAAKNSKSHSARYIAEAVQASEAEIIPNANDYKAGSAVVVLAGEDWNTLEQLYEQVASKIGEQATFVLAATEAVSRDQVREKRAAGDAAGKSIVDNAIMPLNIPPYNFSGFPVPPPATLGSCMLYMEGLNIIVDTTRTGAKGGFAVIPLRGNGTANDQLTWSYNDGDVQCVNGTVGKYIFTVNLRTNADISGQQGTNDVVKIADKTAISFTIVISGDNLGYWYLESATIGKFAVTGLTDFLPGTVTTKENSNSTYVQNVGMTSVQGWAFGCSDSQAMFFPTDNDNVKVGISFFNTELQPFGVWDDNKKIAYFTLNVDDCVGTFSPGSWMAIISILVLLTGFIFGYLMLQSVQTMDRFDDPKQKQILINVRE